MRRRRKFLGAIVDMACSYRGHCLIAAPHLRDPNFYKTVVLIADHGSQGAMGLVINRPSTVLVSHALSKHFDMPECHDLVYMGGPVEPLALFILHNACDLAHNEASIRPGIYLGNSGEVFEEVIQRSMASQPGLCYRVFSGCAGWAPGQLEDEISRGDWYLRTACCESVFQDDPYEAYEWMLKRVHEEHRLLPDPNIDPQWN